MLTGGPSSSFPLLSCQWAGPVGASGSPSRDRRSPAAAEQFDALLVSLPNGHGGCPYRLRTATGAVHFAFEQTGPLSVSEMGLLRKAGVGRLPSITAYLVGPVGASGSPSRARGSPAALNSSGRCRLRVRTVRGAVLFACEQSGALSISRLNRPGRCPFVLSIAAQPVRLCFQSPRNLSVCAFNRRATLLRVTFVVEWDRPQGGQYRGGAGRRLRPPFVAQNNPARCREEPLIRLCRDGEKK